MPGPCKNVIVTVMIHAKRHMHECTKLVGFVWNSRKSHKRQLVAAKTTKIKPQSKLSFYYYRLTKSSKKSRTSCSELSNVTKCLLDMQKKKTSVGSKEASMSSYSVRLPRQTQKSMIYGSTQQWNLKRSCLSVHMQRIIHVEVDILVFRHVSSRFYDLNLERMYQD